LTHLLSARFTGGLNRQIEHHLFPTLPRHNLQKAEKLIAALCSKHGLLYEVRRLLSLGTCEARLMHCSMPDLLHARRHSTSAHAAGGGGTPCLNDVMCFKS